MRRARSVEELAFVVVFVATMYSGSLYGQLAPYLILGQIGLLFWMAVKMPKKRPSATLTTNGLAQVGLLIAFVGVLLLQLGYAVSPLVVGTYVRRLLIFAVLLMVVPKPDVFAHAIRIAKWYGAVVASSILFMAVRSGSRVGGLVGDYQFGGMMMSIACLLFLTDYFFRGGRSRDLIGAGLALIALFVSGKRMFAVVTLVGLAGIYFLSRRTRRSSTIGRVLIALSAILVPAYLLLEPVRVLTQRFQLMSASEYVATSGRNLLWAAAWDVFKAHPVLGIGFGNLIAYLSQNPRTKGLGVNLAHNIYYGLLAETGLVGFVLVVALMITSFMQAVVLYRSAAAKGMHEHSYLLAVCLVLQGWFILYGFTGNGIYDWHEMFFYVNALAIMVSVKTALPCALRSVEGKLERQST